MPRPSRIAAALTLALLAGEASASAESLAPAATECGPQVSRTEAGLAVVPGGIDDTAALQCALDVAIAAGRATSVRLAAGTFRTAQLVARGFVGSLQGAGAGATVLTNVARPVPVAPLDFYLAEPSAENPWPTLVTLLSGDFQVSDMTVRIAGDAPTTGWSIFGIPPIKAFAHAFAVVGARAIAKFTRLEIEGAPAPADPFGFSVGSAIYFEGFLGTNDLAPIAGRFDVHDCTMRQLGAPAPVYNLRDADVTITGNRFEGTSIGVEIVDVEGVRYTFAGNQVDAIAVGVSAYDNCLGGSSVCGVRSSSITVAGNAIRAFDGVELFPTFGPDVSCRIVGNDVDYDAENGGVAVWLGRRTGGCFVSTEGVVRDSGTGNRVITHP